jgi:hypothetical protein
MMARKDQFFFVAKKKHALRATVERRIIGLAFFFFFFRNAPLDIAGDGPSVASEQINFKKKKKGNEPRGTTCTKDFLSNKFGHGL